MYVQEYIYIYIRFETPCLVHEMKLYDYGGIYLKQDHNKTGEAKVEVKDRIRGHDKAENREEEGSDQEL
jgi:hypothetical protein